MSRIGREFLYQALDIGLAETIARTLREVEGVIASYPASGGRRYLERLHEQLRSLKDPSLRTTAALVVSMCCKDPSLTARIRVSFRDLAADDPELAWFYAQLPAASTSTSASTERLRRAG